MKEVENNRDEDMLQQGSLQGLEQVIKQEAQQLSYYLSAVINNLMRSNSIEGIA